MARALIFDCDGVLADTERDGHLPAFNQTFQEAGLPIEWTPEEYGVLLHTGGGKERIRSVLTPQLIAQAGLPTDPGELDALVATWHKRKTELYTQAIAAGLLPGRPGIARISQAAAHAGWLLAVASTSAEPSVRAVLSHAVGNELAQSFAVYAGDIVPKKKPAPDIYLHALDHLGIGPDEAVVVEDSGIGWQAARDAGLRTVVTVSGYTAGDDFTGASLVVTCLGDPPPGEPAQVLANPLGLAVGDIVTLDGFAAILAAPRPVGA